MEYIVATFSQGEAKPIEVDFFTSKEDAEKAQIEMKEKYKGQGYYVEICYPTYVTT